MGRRGLLRALAVVALVVAGIGAVFATSTPAQAAPKPIGLSTDGITYVDSLPASLFAGVLIVPGQSATRTFWVKNRAADPGNVAVALKDVTSVDSIFLGALSLQLTTGSTSGPSVLFSTVNPCRSLLSGITLAPGAVMRVDAVLSLSPSLTASANSIGGFTVPVTLTSTDVAAPNGCAASTGGGTGGGGTGGGGTGGGGTGTHTTPGQIDTAVISGAADGAVDGDPLADTSGNGLVYATEIIPNTARFYQEFDVLGWLAALVLSGIVAMWWSRRDPEENDR